MTSPRILVLDNSPRWLGTSWFGKWFRQVGSQVSFRNYRTLVNHPVKLDPFDGLVVSGSPASATDEDPWLLAELKLVEEADRRNMPVLGVCFGAQLLGRVYYGKEAVRRHSNGGEFGWHTIRRTSEDDPFFEDLPQTFTSFQHHMEEVLPQPGMQLLGTSDAVTVQAFRVGDKPVWATQFHFEVTPQAGRDVLRKTRKVYEPLGWRYEEMIAKARPSEAAPTLFENFVKALQT